MPLRTLGLATSIYLAALTAAQALTFDFAGNWDDQLIGNNLGLSGGFAGSFSFDPDAPGTESASTLYAGARLTLDFGTPAARVTIDPALVEVRDDDPVFADAFTLGLFNPLGPLSGILDPLSGIDALSSFVGVTIQGVSVDLVDLSRTVFDDEALPTAIELVDFTSALLTIRDVDGSGPFAFRIDRIEVSDPAPIPLPASVLFLLAGLGGLLSLRVGAEGRRR